MKSLSSLLAFSLIMAANVSFSQVQLQKRHHLPGYSLDIIKKPTHPKAFVIADGPRMTSIQNAQDKEVSEGTRIIKNEAHSAFYSQHIETDIIKTAEQPTELSPNGHPNKRQQLAISLRKKLSFIPEGAGLILSGKAFKKRSPIEKQVSGDGSIAAALGFILTLVSIFLVILAGIVNIPVLLGLAFFSYFLGVILSFSGRKSANRGFAMFGIVLFWILLGAGILLLIAILVSGDPDFIGLGGGS